jgi:dihydrofolate synthase/folylpolyglutamate synthase
VRLALVRDPAARFADFDAAFRWLSAGTNYETMATQRYDERTYGLSRVEALLEEAGRPDLAYDVVQVVGTKGKGSTAACLASILRATGRRVGLYTSPHLVDPRERILIDEHSAPDRLVVDALERLVPLVEAARGRGEAPTFFEIHTAAALLTFRAAGCDSVVLEAGMGGRLDATTAARAGCKVLTSVSLDHTRQLGRTRTAIAREKASVARKGVPLVCGERSTTRVGRVVSRTCAAAGAPLIAIGRDFDVGRARTAFDRGTGASRTSFDLRLGRRSRTASLTDLEVPLLGVHQARNAALAAVAALVARWSDEPPTADHVRRGLASVRLAARLQLVVPPATEPMRAPLFVDGAHNPASLRALARTIRDAVPHRRAVFVVGMAADKDVAGSLRALHGVASLVVATTSGHPRAVPPADLARLARSIGLRATAADDIESAVRLASRRSGPRDVVVVTGSLYLCGAFLRLWREEGGTTIPPPAAEAPRRRRPAGGTGRSHA